MICLAHEMSFARAVAERVIFMGICNGALHHAEEIREAGFSDDWQYFLRRWLRRAGMGYGVTSAQLMPGSMIGGAPIFNVGAAKIRQTARRARA